MIQLAMDAHRIIICWIQVLVMIAQQIVKHVIVVLLVRLANATLDMVPMEAEDVEVSFSKSHQTLILISLWV